MTWTYVPCGCGCRAEDAPEPCACIECRPGPGLEGVRWAVQVRTEGGMEARMMILLHRPTLTETETAELDGLLDWYVNKE